MSIEFFTLSKSYNMGGFRVGYAIGNAEVIRSLRQIKAIVDFNQYQGIFNGAITALTGPQDSVQQMVHTFQQRRDALVDALQANGWKVAKPQAAMYVWAKLPDAWGTRSVEFGQQLVQATGVAVSPGAGFGKSGEGYIRLALVQAPEILREAVQRMQQFLAHS